MAASEEVKYQPISARQTWFYLWIVPLAAVGLWLWAVIAGSKDMVAVPLIVGAAVAVLWSGWAFFMWLHASRELLTEQQHKNLEDWIEGHWFARYCMAAGLLCGAAWIPDVREKLWWLSLILVIWAAILAREILILLIVGAIVIAIFKGLTTISTGAAIIVGACIIAYAIVARGK